MVNTRPPHQAANLTAKLREADIRSIEVPALEITEPESWKPVDNALRNVENYDWLVFTSQNGVERFFNRADQKSMSSNIFSTLRTAAIGPATARSLRNRVDRVDVLPDEYRSENLAKALLNTVDPGESVLLPRSNVARPVLVDLLTEEGISVNEIHPYRLAKPTDFDPEHLRQPGSSEIDLICFTSSMIVRNFDELLDEHRLQHLRKIPAACIGPITKKTVKKRGYKTAAVADEYTMDGLVNAVQAYIRANC